MLSKQQLFFFIDFVLFLLINTVDADGSSSSSSKSIFQAKLATTNIGRFKYQDGEVLLSQNQLRSTDFFFTPFPHIEPNLTECNYNDLSGHCELTLSVSLYTSHLVNSIEQHLKQYYNICRIEHCDVSLLPMHSIRLHQKGLRTRDSQQKYVLDNDWHSNTQLRQSIEFIIYTTNMSVCQHLKISISSHCHLSNFEIHYLLHDQQIVARQLEITTEHITNTFMYNQIKSQFDANQQDTIALTGDDFKNLISDINEQITMNLRVDEGYDSLQDPISIEKILDRQLHYKQMQLKELNDHLWNSLYWTSDLTRPDRLSKILNKIIRHDEIDSNRFLYDHSQLTEDIRLNLKHDERIKLDNLQKHLTDRSQNVSTANDIGIQYGAEGEISVLGFDVGKVGANLSVQKNMEKMNSTKLLNDTLTHQKQDSSRLNAVDNQTKNNTIFTMKRKDAEKILGYLSEHVQLEGDIIKPKPIDAKLLKFGSLKSNTKLSSNTILVKTRTNVHVLPLRCPYRYRQHASMNTWLEDRYEHLSNVVKNFTNIIFDLHEKVMNNLNRTRIEHTQAIKTTDTTFMHHPLFIYGFNKLADAHGIGKMMSYGYVNESKIETVSIIQLNPLMVSILFQNRMWFQGMVCDDFFTTNAALIACRSFHGHKRRANFSSIPWTPTNICKYGFEDVSLSYQCDFILNKFSCNSESYTSLQQGHVQSIFKHNCDKNEHIKLVCT